MACSGTELQKPSPDTDLDSSKCGLAYASRLKPKAEKGGGMGGRELLDGPGETAKKIVQLAEMLKEARNCVILTGAGISTSAGVADFRGPNGIWTAEKRGLPPPACISFDRANPTLTHMAITGLVQCGVVKLVISQNVDGLHMRSGIPRDKLAELHGNLFLETCEVCGFEYLRDFDVGGISFRKTGRFCNRPGCGGALRDTLLDWDDALPEADFLKAETALRDCDLCLCMGTSLRIRPASELPLISVRAGGRLVICNLQNTPKDRHASLNIHAPVDNIMSGVMALLGYDIPAFRREVEMCTKAQLVRGPSAEVLSDVEVSIFGSAGEKCALPLVDKCWLEIVGGERRALQGPPWAAQVSEQVNEVKFVVSFAGQMAGLEFQREESVLVSLEGVCKGALTTTLLLRAVEIDYEIHDRNAPVLSARLKDDARIWAEKKASLPPCAESVATRMSGGVVTRASRKRESSEGGGDGEAGGRGWVQCENKACQRWGRPRHPPARRQSALVESQTAASGAFYCRRRCAAEAQAYSDSHGQGEGRRPLSPCDTAMAPGEGPTLAEPSSLSVKSEQDTEGLDAEARCSGL